MDTWEYMTFIISIESQEEFQKGCERLYSAGMMGWELVSVVAFPNGRELYLKRKWKKYESN